LRQESFKNLKRAFTNALQRRKKKGYDNYNEEVIIFGTDCSVAE
jgi:hypothetical protein